MILIIDMCWKKDSLSAEEFVRPIENIVRNSGHFYTTMHFSEITHKRIDGADKIIMCGTALMDNFFLENEFSWLKQCEKPVLGICAGMEIIAKVFGGDITESREIGMMDITTNDKIFGKEKTQVYQLHGKGVTVPPGFEKIAWNENGVHGIKRDHIYGIQFHPEVRNESVLINWLKT